MKKLAQHSDSLFATVMILVLVFGAGVLWWQWQSVRDYWKTNFDKWTVPREEISSGVMGRDQVIVPIDEPVFISVESALLIVSHHTPVIAVDYYGVERAYPLTILTAHEIVNDWLGDVPVAVTFCPMCNSPVVYRREVDGMVLRMGVSGNFYGNNFLMYDDLTESWWFQFTGEAIVGDYTGTVLETVPSQVVVFETFALRYPYGEVLAGDALNSEINYNRIPVDAYQSSQSPILTHDDYDPRLSAMARVLSTTIDDVPLAYPFDVLKEAGVINHSINGHDLVVFWQAGVSSPDNQGSESVGQASVFERTVRGMSLTFRYDNGRIFDNETGSEWNIFGEAIAGELEGETLYKYQCFTHFWFAWSSAYPDTLVYGQ